ncbi:MAG: methylcrotonoyl-CoA carboxylase, partial [Chloroflexi bacterium]|nr:methylcrotonoyl-CoA carboxylase [Chloroflexota bacterium]
MGILETRVDPSSAEFKANADYNRGLVAILRERLEQVRQGGGREAMERHRSRGKLPARERIERLCDPHTPF